MRSKATRVITVALITLATGCSPRLFKLGAASAMAPTIQANETVLADMAAYRTTAPQRWDVVAFRPPPSISASGQLWIMRVVGLPGERLEIRDGNVYVDGRQAVQPAGLVGTHYLTNVNGHDLPMVSHPYTIPAGSYFLMGDNTADSLDSRFWGALPKTSILGKVQGK